MVNTANISSRDLSVAEMESHVARFGEQKSSSEAFLDTRIPGHEREIFGIIGNGVQEDPNMRPPLAAEDFHLAMIRALPGKGAALHSHLTQEVFVPLSGRWSIFWGPEGAKEVVLEPYDVISVPINIMRGFRNVSDHSAMMLAVVGGHDPGRVGWPDSLKAMALDAGLTIDENGDLVEVTASEPSK